MRFLAESSRQAYRAFLEDPDFIPFFRSATPIDVLEQSRIGSRPSRRTGAASLDDLRAIPWVFSWTQARFYLPNWFGTGSGLARLAAERPELYQGLAADNRAWPLARYVLVNVETGLASASRRWMEAYAALVPDQAVGERLLQVVLAEHTETTTQLNRLLGGNLADRRPRFAKTLALRERGLDLLHYEQLRLMQAWRAAGRPDEKLLPELLLTVNAIASGLRTTG